MIAKQTTPPTLAISTNGHTEQAAYDMRRTSAYGTATKPPLLPLRQRSLLSASNRTQNRKVSSSSTNRIAPSPSLDESFSSTVALASVAATSTTNSEGYATRRARLGGGSGASCATDLTTSTATTTTTGHLTPKSSATARSTSTTPTAVYMASKTSTIKTSTDTSTQQKRPPPRLPSPALPAVHETSRGGSNDSSSSCSDDLGSSDSNSRHRLQTFMPRHNRRRLGRFVGRQRRNLAQWVSQVVAWSHPLQRPSSRNL